MVAETLCHAEQDGTFGLLNIFKPLRPRRVYNAPHHCGVLRLPAEE